MNFSKRSAWSIAQNPWALLLECKRRAQEPLLDLTQSNPTACGFRFLDSQMLKSLASPKNLIYEPDPRGLIEAREAVCRYYSDKKIEIQPEQVFLTSSTSEAYSFLLRLLCDPQEAVLAPKPGYPLFDHLAQLNDVELLNYALTYDDGWRIDLSSLKENPKAKAIILVNPNNPTGNFVHPEERQAIVSWCQQHDLAIISDEVFLDFAASASDAALTTAFPSRSLRSLRVESRGRASKPLLGPVESGPDAEESSVLTFALSGVSKILGLPQMKLSWIVVAGPEVLRRQAMEKLEIIADTYLSVNTPSQRALGEWMKQAQSIRDEILERVLTNRRVLKKALASSSFFKLLESEGGWYAILKIESSKSLDDEALAIVLLEKHNLLVHPGYFFDFPEGHFLVLSLLPEPQVFQKAAEILQNISYQ